MLRSVFGLGRSAAEPATRRAEGSVCFAAIADKRMVGSVTLQPPAARRGGGWRPAVARLVRMDVDAEHEKLGCPQALLDVARIWASASEYDALEVSVPAAPVGVVDFYLANGFHIVSSSHDAGSRRLNVVLSLKLAESRPHSDAWYSKHHGAWFASMTRH